MEINPSNMGAKPRSKQIAKNCIVNIIKNILIFILSPLENYSLFFIKTKDKYVTKRN
jgi:hypothetical protein